MKKALAMILAIAMTFCLTACGETSDDTATTTTTAEAVTTTTVAENENTTTEADATTTETVETTTTVAENENTTTEAETTSTETVETTTTQEAVTTTEAGTTATTTEQGVGQITTENVVTTTTTTVATTTTTAKPTTTTTVATTTTVFVEEMPPFIPPTTTTIPPRDPSLGAEIYQLGDTWVVDGKFELTLTSAQRGCFKPNEFVKQNEVDIGFTVKSQIAGDEYINLRAYDKYVDSGYDSEVYLTEPRTITGETHFFITSTEKYVWVRATYGDHEATFALLVTGSH